MREDIDKLNEQYCNTCLFVYNSIISDYNVIAEAYNDILKNTSVHFIEGMKQDNVKMKETYNSIEEINLEVEEICSFLDNIIEETNILVIDYLIAKQITNPTEDWIIERLEKVDSITGMQAVTKTNDPNGLLGKEGGYTSWIYFTVTSYRLSNSQQIALINEITNALTILE